MSTIASSTTEPIATTSPPRVMVLIPSPRAFISIRPISKESGMALRLITAARQFIRNSTITTDTITTPNSSDSLTLRMALSMKLPCRKVCWTCTSAGRVRLRSASRRSTARVTVGVSTSGCLVTISTTAGLPLKLASPRLRAAPRFTSARVESSTGCPCALRTAVSARSLTWVIWARGRISRSWPPPIRKPPGLVAIAAPTPSITAWSDTVCTCSSCGSSST
jgi:hypothetical protein